MMTALENILAGQNRKGTGWPTIVLYKTTTNSGKTIKYSVIETPSVQTLEGLLFTSLRSEIYDGELDSLKAIFNVVIIDEEAAK